MLVSAEAELVEPDFISREAGADILVSSPLIQLCLLDQLR